MPNVEKITKQTENPFVNLYLVEGTNKVNHHFRYYVASRAKSIEQMKIKTRKKPGINQQIKTFANSILNLKSYPRKQNKKNLFSSLRTTQY